MKGFCYLLLVCITNLFTSFTFLRSEKILLHTDHSDYRQGDTISFSGTLLEATTLEPSTYSKYVYIELINRILFCADRNISVTPLVLRESYFSKQICLPVIIICVLILV